MKHELLTLKVNIASSKGLSDKQVRKITKKILNAVPKRNADVDVICAYPRFFKSNYKQPKH